MSWLLVEERPCLASRAVEENIQKARKAFFHLGSIGAFQGDLSPLSSRSVASAWRHMWFQVLLYSYEIWIVTERILQQLEACMFREAGKEGL